MFLVSWCPSPGLSFVSGDACIKPTVLKHSKNRFTYLITQVPSYIGRNSQVEPENLGKWIPPRTFYSRRECLNTTLIMVSVPDCPGIYTALGLEMVSSTT
jgi:hypothetical protein